DETDEIGAEGRKRCRQRILIGKIQLAEHEPGRGAVEEEIVPLDGGANGGCDDCLAQLRSVVGFGQGCVRDECRHVSLVGCLVSLQEPIFADSTSNGCYNRRATSKRSPFAKDTIAAAHEPQLHTYLPFRMNP